MLSHMAHRRSTKWSKLVSVLYDEDGLNRTAVATLRVVKTRHKLLVLDGEDAAYFSIQPSSNQFDDSAFEFPLSLPALQQDIPFLEHLLPPKALKSVNLCFGRSGVAHDSACAPTHAHFHNNPRDNMYAVGIEKKRYRIWPPSAATELKLITPPAGIEKCGYVENFPAEKKFKGYRFSHVPSLGAFKSEKCAKAGPEASLSGELLRAEYP